MLSSGSPAPDTALIVARSGGDICLVAANLADEARRVRVDLGADYRPTGTDQFGHSEAGDAVLDSGRTVVLVLRPAGSIRWRGRSVTVPVH